MEELEETTEVPLRGNNNNEDQYRPSFNVAPTRYQPVVLRDKEDFKDKYTGGLLKESTKKPKRQIGCKTDFPYGVTMFFMRWHLPFAPTLNLHNARAESLAGLHIKQSFNRFKSTNRCIIIANGYYEWHQSAEGAKTPYFFQRKDGKPCYFAGLYGWSSSKKYIISLMI